MLTYINYQVGLTKFVIPIKPISIAQTVYQGSLKRKVVLTSTVYEVVLGRTEYDYDQDRTITTKKNADQVRVCTRYNGFSGG